MLLNEAGLVRAIKRAHKNGGYTVSNQGGRVSIYTECWYIQTKRDALPRKALAAIAEHMGMIPERTAVFIEKDMEEPQIVLEETAVEDVNGWRIGERGDGVDMTPVIMQGLQIFQSEGGACWGIPLSCLSMIERDTAEFHEAVVVDENRLVWNDGAEAAAVKAVRKAKSGWAKAWERAVWQALESVDLHKEEDHD